MMSPQGKLIHKVIANAAKGIAEAAYEALAREDAFYRLNPSARGYVARNWRLYIPYARQSLTQILTKDYSLDIAMGSQSPESVARLKEEVYEALLIDGEYKAPPRLEIN